MTPTAIEDQRRCAWARGHDALRDYHDREWGVPEWDSRALWEKLMLDGFQAGLSWRTILDKRAAFRLAFDAFEPARVARYDEGDVSRLLANADIVRSEAKIRAVIGNARAYLRLEAEGLSFADFVWGYVDHRPRRGDGIQVPTRTDTSAALAADLKRRGFAFVGPTIVYAWMQAVGMVNDHEKDCFRRAACSGEDANGGKAGQPT